MIPPSVQAALDDADELVRVTQQPRSIRYGQMRDYQIEGLNWLVNLHLQGINGILADEMGLGKTLQSISVCTFLRDEYGINGKHLVIVPKSTIGNWHREFNRWAPCFKVFKFIAQKKERQIMKAQMLQGDWDVCVTSYEMVKIEKAHFLKVRCRCVETAPLVQSAVQPSILEVCSSALDVVWNQVLRGPYPD